MKFEIDKDNDLSTFDDLSLKDEEKKFKGWVYHPNPDHRGIKNIKKKAKWDISVDEEIICFVYARKSNWINGDKGWGLHLSNNEPQKVGRLAKPDNRKQRYSWIARFHDGTSTSNWHGWPADTKLKTNDRPTTEVLKDWKKKGYITKAILIKILKGLL